MNWIYHLLCLGSATSRQTLDCDITSTPSAMACQAMIRTRSPRATPSLDSEKMRKGAKYVVKTVRFSGVSRLMLHSLSTPPSPPPGMSTKVSTERFLRILV